MSESQIIIKDLKFYGFHGVYPEEQVVGTSYKADITIDIDDSFEGFKTDRLEDTLNYEKIVETVLKIATRQKFHLIERLAQVIGENIIAFEHVMAADVTIYKSVTRLTPEPQWMGVRRKITRAIQK